MKKDLSDEDTVYIECGKIVAFDDAEVEKIQELVTLENGFKPQSHNMMLYGICTKCQSYE